MGFPQQASNDSLAEGPRRSHHRPWVRDQLPNALQQTEGALRSTKPFAPSPPPAGLGVGLRGDHENLHAG
jgi:hypothetical protein